MEPKYDIGTPKIREYGLFNDDIASVDDRTPQRLTGVFAFGNVNRDRYPDERERQRRVG